MYSVKLQAAGVELTNHSSGPVRFNAEYRGGLECEGVRKHLPGDNWGTKRFQTHSMGMKYFSKKQLF